MIPTILPVLNLRKLKRLLRKKAVGPSSESISKEETEGGSNRSSGETASNSGETASSSWETASDSGETASSSEKEPFRKKLKMTMTSSEPEATPLKEMFNFFFLYFFLCNLTLNPSGLNLYFLLILIYSLFFRLFLAGKYNT